MGITERDIRRLLPRGLAWLLPVDGGKLLRAIASTIERVRAYTDNLVADSQPGTATDTTIAEWYETIGLRFDSTLPIATQRSRLESFLISAGGATKTLLEKQIQLEYPDVTIEEITASAECGLDESGVAVCGGTDADYSPRYYDVVGTVDTEEDAQRLGEILARFAPYHLFASTDSLVALSLSATAECGLSVCGYEECGNDGL